MLEWVEGARIDRHCNTQRLGIDARLALFDSVLAAVAHVHTHGVIREAGYDDGLIEVLCSQIDGDLMAGQRDKAQARLSEAQQMLARQKSPLPVLEARCLAAAAEVAEADKQLTDAVALAQRALARLTAGGLQNHGLMGATLSRLAEYHHGLGDARKGHEWSAKAIAEHSAGGKVTRTQRPHTRVRFIGHRPRSPCCCEWKKVRTPKVL